MLKTTLTLAAVSLTLLLSTSVFAQKVEYLGAHTVVAGADPFNFVSGGQGVLDFNRRCAAAFEGAQMCESIDILRSGSLPDAAAQAAGVLQWVKPTILQVVQDPNGATETLIYDASGVARLSPGGLIPTPIERDSRGGFPRAADYDSPWRTEGGFSWRQQSNFEGTIRRMI